MPRDITLTQSEADLLPYDLDRSGSLSVSEMARVNDADVSDLLETRLISGQLSTAQAVDWLVHLQGSKAARVLHFMDDRRSPGLFSELFRQNAAAALRILSYSRESLAGPASCRGIEAVHWLTALSAGDRLSLLGMLVTLDPSFASHVGAAMRLGARALCDRDLESAVEIVDNRNSPPPAARPYRAEVAGQRRAVVAMRAYGVASAATHDLLLTSGVSTCSVLTLYDPLLRVGVLAHFDVGSDYQNSLDLIFADLAARGVPVQHLVARIVGGNSSLTTSRRLTSDLVERLRLEGMRIAEAETEASGFQMRSFLLDLRTGNLEEYRGAYLAEDATRRDDSHPTLLGRTLESAFAPR